MGAFDGTNIWVTNNRVGRGCDQRRCTGTCNKCSNQAVRDDRRLRCRCEKLSTFSITAVGGRADDRPLLTSGGVKANEAAWQRVYLVAAAADYALIDRPMTTRGHLATWRTLGTTTKRP